MNSPNSPDCNSPSLRIFLWTSPRCLSTVFDRSIRELEGVKPIFEPHVSPYYYGPERKYQTSSTQLKPDATFQATDETLLQSYPEHSAVFCKTFAHNVNHDYRQYTTGKFSVFKHTFLIRNPRKAIPSLYKACKESVFDDYNDGFQELYEMYETIRLNVDPHPLVIDADDLLADPKGIMQRYCEATGLTFNEGMLTWTPGVVDDWIFADEQPEDQPYEQWVHYCWIATVAKSSGFIKPAEKENSEKSLEAKVAALPQEIKDAIDKALPYYDALYKNRIKNKN